MEKYYILIGVIDKQIQVMKKLYNEITIIDLTNMANQYMFALKTQQLYTAIEDLMKSTAKTF